MILVTGSTGHFGKAAINFLLEKVPANTIAALARDENKAADLKAKGIDVRIGSYQDFDSLVKAFTGIDKLLLISSNDLNDRTAQHINAVNAAKEAGVKHIVYTGVNIKEKTNYAIPSLVESHITTTRHLKDSGLAYTLLNNNLYADVLPMFIGDKVLETGIFFPAGDGKAPFATRENMAEAAANILTSDGHENKAYAISSGVTYTFSDVADILSELSGNTINYVSPEKEVYVETLTKAGVPAEYVNLFAGFGDAINQGEFDLPNNTLETLIDRKPTALKDYLKAIYFSNN